MKGKGSGVVKTVSMNCNQDFRRLYRKEAQVGSVLVTYFSKNRLAYRRVGITASKKIGKAHERNRARRVIREAYRLLEPQLLTDYGVDIVFVARTKTCLCSMQEVYRVMKRQLAPYLKKDEKDH